MHNPMPKSSSKSTNERLKAILKAGNLFESKYRIMRPLGAGSFALVVHARHEVMERDVALKFLKPKVVASNPEVSERFIKEVQIASRLKHPNVVAIYDFGETDDGIYYMVQEFVDGVTVDALLPEGRPLEPERVISFCRQALSCLAEAHSHGIIHRDLKPSNLMATTSETGEEIIKILDFGVAKLLEKDETGAISQIRQSTKFIGTPIYMSPEQILGREVQPSSDLYSVGLMLYEMITGQAPIQAEQIAEVVQQHLSDDPFDFPMIHLLSEPMQQVIYKATARHPKDRFADADAFSEALRVASGEATSGSDDVASPDLVDEAIRKGEERFAEEKRRRQRLAEEGSEGEELDAFLGKNYIGLDAEEFEPTFKPLTSEEQGASGAPPAASSSSIPGAGPPAADAAQSGRARRRKEAARHVAKADASGSGIRRADAAPSAAGGSRRRLEPSQRNKKPKRPPQPQERMELEGNMTPGEGDPGESALTDMGELELDMDAMRSVAYQRRRAANVERKKTREKFELDDEEQDSVFHPIRIPLYLGALASFYICFVLLSAVTDLMPHIVRILIGLSPIALCAVWVGMESRGPGTFGERWLVPISIRSFILLGCALFLITLILPDKAAIALEHEGVWFFEPFPDVPPFNWARGATEVVTKGASKAFAAIAEALPW